MNENPEQRAEADNEQEQESGSGLGAALVTILAILIIAAGASTLGWRIYQEDRASDAEEIAALRAQVNSLSRSLETLESSAATTQAIAALEDRTGSRIRDMDRRVSGAEDAVGALRDDIGSGRADWDLAQAAYLLEMSVEHLAITGDARAALRALDAADARLATHADPALRAVRARLAEDRAALRTLEAVDRPGIALALAAMTEQVGQLPIADRPAAGLAHTAEPAATHGLPWYRRAWSRITGTLSGLFELKRLDEPPTPLLTGQEVFLLRAQIETALTTARLSAMQGDGPNYQASLQRARDLIDSHLDATRPVVAGFVTQLDELAAVDVAPVEPDVGGALAMLQRHIESMRGARTP